MKVRTIDTGVRIFAGEKFLDEIWMRCVPTAETQHEDRAGQYQTLMAEEMCKASVQNRGKQGYSIDLSVEVASWLMARLDDYIDTWRDWTAEEFEWWSVIRSGRALVRHLTKYGLKPSWDADQRYDERVVEKYHLGPQQWQPWKRGEGGYWRFTDEAQAETKEQKEQTNA